MASPFQTAILFARPLYPNAIAWSEENLVAVAAGTLITIHNPALLAGPRSLITVQSIKPYPIGLVAKEDLSNSCLLPTCLSRDTTPYARSISWSPRGLAPNSGCLLAVCTTEGSVKLYRQPVSEFRAEWIEVADISDLLHGHLVRTDFGEKDVPPKKTFSEGPAECQQESGCASFVRCSSLSNRGTFEDQISDVIKNADANNGFTPLNKKRVTAGKAIMTFPCLFKKNTSVEVLQQNGGQRFWVKGIIDHRYAGRALVQYPENGTGMKDEWVEVNNKVEEISGSNIQGSIEPDSDAPSPKIRPYMDVGNFPKEIPLLKFRDSEGILSSGQAVEAWLDDRWVEGSYLGFNEHGLLVELSGVSGSVTLDSGSVRLAPYWNCSLNSWHVPLIKTELEELEAAKATKMKSKKGRDYEENLSKRRRTIDTSTKITAKQYSSRSGMLSCTTVAWSQLLQLSSESNCGDLNSFPSHFSLLSVGGKSGKISFWRICGPQNYSIVHNSVSVDVMLVGLLEAHNKWITAICWETISMNGSNSQVILTTGSSDGSVKIWRVDTEGLLSSSEIDCSSIYLLKEVKSASSSSISVLSVTAPTESPGKLFLAVGRVSGSLDIWICDISNCEFQFSGSYDPHIQVVTGLTWAFNGRCLYSCSQDDSICSWILQGNSFYEATLPSTSLVRQGFTDRQHVSNSCFGLAISPGNLVAVVVRALDPDFLDEMYEARTLKAAVEFFWIGGQQLESSSDRCLVLDNEAIPGSPETEMMCWESSILWSLKQYEHVEKPLVVWDVISALFAVKHFSPSDAHHILVTWFSSWFVDSDVGLSIENILLRASRFLFNFPSRKLHLLNIICRRFILSGLATDIYSGEGDMSEEDGFEDEQPKLWTDLLNVSEKELRERLVRFHFAFVLTQKSSSATITPVGRHWHPVGIAQMEQWVATQDDGVHDQLQILASKIKKLGCRLQSVCADVSGEQCNYCSTSVPFESPEVGFCVGKKCTDGVVQSHKLVRCAVSMQICPSTPLWYCVCCQRSVSQLPPQSLFTFSEHPLDLNSLIESLSPQVISIPLCPFCGILLQRLQPELLLSTSPV